MAEIGTMKVTEELTRCGHWVSHHESARASAGHRPRHRPSLLTVYADIVGVFGGMLIAGINVSFVEFIADSKKRFRCGTFSSGWERRVLCGDHRLGGQLSRSQKLEWR